MKMPTRLMAAAALLILSASPLLPAMADERGYEHGGPPQGHWDNRGNEHRDGPGHERRDGPPRDFGPVRQAIRDNHGYFVRGAPPPPGIRLVRGQPLPRGYYGERLDPRALSRLPVYHGYEWRRMGGDIFLIEVGSGIVYDILDGVLY
ncbi:RcnB family protein [Pseudomonas sp. NFXW11]|uniref:RcnB family protein n=1 Tax=Pseudomonas sp. NFXW11 TaxID=2819531 RepID=UPI003CF90FDC